MLALRVSATDLDAFRRYRSEEEVDLADLLSQLRREGSPTPAMQAGTALHAALEMLADGEHEAIAVDGYRFDFTGDFDIALPEIREMKATRDYRVGDVVVTLVGKVDAILGRCVYDHKLTGNYDAERFLSTYQWRVYLEVFGADEFRWNVFEGRETNEKHWTVKAVHELRMHRYPGMSADVEREVSHFVEFAKMHLPEKLVREAA